MRGSERVFASDDPQEPPFGGLPTPSGIVSGATSPFDPTAIVLLTEQTDEWLEAAATYWSGIARHHERMLRTATTELEEVRGVQEFRHRCAAITSPTNWRGFVRCQKPAGHDGWHSWNPEGDTSLLVSW